MGLTICTAELQLLRRLPFTAVEGAAATLDDAASSNTLLLLAAPTLKTAGPKSSGNASRSLGEHAESDLAREDLLIPIRFLKLRNSMPRRATSPAVAAAQLPHSEKLLLLP